MGYTRQQEGWRKAAATHERHKREHIPRHTDAFMGSEEGTAFLLGTWVKVRSRWLLAAKYEQEEGRLYIEFGDDKGRSTAIGYYDGVSFEEAERFASAPSKGGFLHDGGYMTREFIKYF